MSADRSEHVEPAHDLLRVTPRKLDMFFEPTAVAVVGASIHPGSVGHTLAVNLLRNREQRQVFLVNPTRDRILDQTCYPRVVDVPAKIDVAVIAVPAKAVPDVIADCLAAGVRGAIVISAGFREIGAEGILLEERVRDLLRGGAMRVIGPNCLGVMSPIHHFNATFAADMARPGNIALVSQSGAILTAVLDWSLGENVGFSHIVSIGSMLNVDWGDLIDYLGDDPSTRAILLYMESIGNARAFLSAAREVALRKPIIVIKAGRSEQAAQAAASHTGTLVGSDQVLDAAFRRAGVLRVRHISALFEMAEVLAKQALPQGPNLAIITNAGGPGVLAADALIEGGGSLSTLSDKTIAALDKVLPAHWSKANPIDVLGDATPDRFGDAAKILLEAPECHGLLAIVTPQAMTDPTQIALRLAEYGRGTRKPIIAAWMGGERVKQGIELLNQSGIPTLPYPDGAARMFRYMWRRSDDLRALYETPVLAADGEFHVSHAQVAKALDGILATGRCILTEIESKQLLVANGIPTVDTRLATTRDEALEQAREIGYPVVLKLHSTTITHKARVGGVRLNLSSDQNVLDAFSEIGTAVERAAGPGNFHGVTVQPMVNLQGYELIFGSSVDAQLGPVILFGAGGSMVEVFRDQSLGLPPLTSTLARRIMERTKIYSVLRSGQGTTVDLAALEQLFVRFASLVVEYPRIREIDINPILVQPQGCLALDARVVLHPAGVLDADLPRPAIRPFPRKYVSRFTNRQGREFLVRPIRPEDETLLAKFHQTLSDRTVYARYAQLLSLSKRTLHDRLARLCFIDYDRQMALVAIDPTTPDANLVAVVRLIKFHEVNSAEFAIVISDAYQRQGLGSYLMNRLVEIGHDEHLDKIIGYIQPTNVAMLALCRRMGFRITDDSYIRVAVLDLPRDAS